jgi:hypothetical protein
MGSRTPEYVCLLSAAAFLLLMLHDVLPLGAMLWRQQLMGVDG